MTAVIRTQGSDSTRAAVWIERIGFCRFVGVIDISHWDLVVGLDTFVNRFIGEVESSLSVCHPYTERRAFQ